MKTCSSRRRRNRKEKVEEKRNPSLCRVSRVSFSPFCHHGCFERAFAPASASLSLPFAWRCGLESNGQAKVIWAGDQCKARFPASGSSPENTCEAWENNDKSLVSHSSWAGFARRSIDTIKAIMCMGLITDIVILKTSVPKVYQIPPFHTC